MTKVRYSHDLNEKLYDLRVLNGYTIPQVQKLSGYSRQHLYNVESKNARPTEDCLERLAKVYHVKHEDLINPNRTAPDIIPPEYILPDVAVLVHDKTENQLRREEELLTEMRTSEDRLNEIIRMYNVSCAELARATGMTAYVVRNAARGQNHSSDVVFAKLAKALGLDPLYFKVPAQERTQRRNERRDNRIARQKDEAPPALALEDIVPITKTSEQLKLEEQILRLPSVTDRYQKLRALYNLTFEELSDGTGIAVPTLTRIAHFGHASNSTRNRIASYYGINPNSLLESDTEHVPKSADTAFVEAVKNMQSSSIFIQAIQFLAEAGSLFQLPDCTSAEKDRLLSELSMFYKGTH